MQVFRTLLAAGLLLLTHAGVQAQSCCQLGSQPAPETQFASLADDARFRGMHDLPLPFVLAAPKGEMITFPTADSRAANAYLLKAKKATDKWLLVFHEWWGLNDYVKQEAERLQAALGVNVLAIDMYDGKVATTQQNAAQYMQGLDPNRATAILTGGMTYVGPNAKVGTIGWCMGGGMSFKATMAAGKQAQACVIYYGQPATDAATLAGLNAPVLFIWPTQDQWINAELVNSFREGMKQAGKQLTVREYNADHAFANPSNPKHNEALTKDANQAAIAFLKANLK